MTECNHHDAIIDRDTWDAVQKRFKENRQEREKAMRRSKRVLHVITANPKVKNKRIANITGISEDKVGQVITNLQHSGRITWDGDKWKVNEEEPESSNPSATGKYW